MCHGAQQFVGHPVRNVDRPFLGNEKGLDPFEWRTLPQPPIAHVRLSLSQSKSTCASTACEPIGAEPESHAQGLPTKHPRMFSEFARERYPTPRLDTFIDLPG